MLVVAFARLLVSTTYLEMKLNKFGEFRPVLSGDCKVCDICGKVCPQLREEYPHADLEGFLSLTPEALLGSGGHFRTWAGYNANLDQRLQSASGGLLTLVLASLFKTNRIDAAVVVDSAAPGSERLFAAKVVTKPRRTIYLCRFKVLSDRAFRSLKGFAFFGCEGSRGWTPMSYKRYKRSDPHFFQI